jgi:uncharacterized RDD family membrane protein YckC
VLLSGEAVAFDVRVARIGSRGVALLLDVAIQAAILLIVLPLVLIGLAATVPFNDAALTRAAMLVCVVLVLVGYPVAFETAWRGRTPGKLALGLRVVRDDGGPIRFRHALTRSLVAAAVEWPGLVLPLFTWLASLATMLAHPQGKRLGDLAAGTIVIHERTPAAWGWVPGMPPALAGWATTLDLTALDDDLALAVRHFLARGHSLAEPERGRLGRALAGEVAAATTPPPPPGFPGWAYLAAVLAERHRRAAHRLARARATSAQLWPDLATPGRPMPMPHGPPADRPQWGPPTTGPTTGPTTRDSPTTGWPAPTATDAATGAKAWQGTATDAATWGGGPTAAAAWGPNSDAAPTAGSPVVSGGSAGGHWPSHAWPEPPWRAPEDGGDPDWTGLRPPRIASALRPTAPRPTAPRPTAPRPAAPDLAAPRPEERDG